MNKQQFLAAMAKQLSDMEQSERESSLAYYEEMLNDRMEEGMTEEQAVADMEDVDEITAAILAEPNVVQVIKEKIIPKRSLRGWEIALIALGSPLWLALLIAAAAVVIAVAATLLSLYLTLWMLVGVLYIVSASFGLCALFGIIGGVWCFFTEQPHFALFMLGSGLLLGGLCVLVFLGSNLAAKGMIKGTALIFGKKKINKGEE